MRRSILKLLVPVLVLCVLGCGILPANAAAKPTVSWSLAKTANENESIPFSWSAKHLGRNHKLVVQRPFGTARVWRSIKRLPTDSGSAELPGFSLGIHRFRIAAFRGNRLLAQQASPVRVFGQVPFATLFNVRQNKVLTTPQYTFPYVNSYYDNGDDPEMFQVSNNNCTSVHIGFVAREYYEHDSPGTVKLTLVQESNDPINASAAFNTISSLDAKLVVGQSWAVNQSHIAGNEIDAVMNYINGYAVCDSTEPFRH